MLKYYICSYVLFHIISSASEYCIWILHLKLKCLSTISVLMYLKHALQLDRYTICYIHMIYNNYDLVLSNMIYCELRYTTIRYHIIIQNWLAHLSLGRSATSTSRGFVSAAPPPDVCQLRQSNCSSLKVHKTWGSTILLHAQTHLNPVSYVYI